MKRCLIALAVTLALVLSLGVVPVMAVEEVDVPTRVFVEGGTTTPPLVKCKWEQDDTASLEDGDTTHQTAGSQFLPPLVYEGVKLVQYWAVVTDPQGVGTVKQVSVDVYHPDTLPLCGAKKYQIILEKVDKFEMGMPGYVAARDAGLVTYHPAFTDAEVMDELEKCTAEVYMGEEYLSYHQPAGAYMVWANACDNGNAWASENGTDLVNYFDYVAGAGMEIDFTEIDYGGVETCVNKWIAGDTVFDATPGVAPTDNRATVRNIGNVDIQLTVHQDDMGFGFNGTEDSPDWNVVYDARLGNDTSNEVTYVPSETATLPNKLPLCNTEELDLSIHVKKSVTGEHVGNLTLGLIPLDFGPCDQQGT
jgi:hypothetical protein